MSTRLLKPKIEIDPSAPDGLLKTMHLKFCYVAFAFLLAAPLFGQEEARIESPERTVQPGVPQGKVTSGVFADSKVFPGTRREFSVYVPAQYDGKTPVKLMVFQDGPSYAKADGPFRVPVVLDNLIHQNVLSPMIAVFVAPGTLPPEKDGAMARSNRSFEYDSMGDRYSRFLIDEFLPVALKDLNVSALPADRAVGGISSGAICAFTVAWERPDQFGRVLSHIGSYTNIRGGWAYPGLLRKTKEHPKPIKVYLQEGVDDLNNLHGNWPLANQDMAAALRFAGYDFKLEMTNGGHSGNAGGKVLPNALRWLWSDEKDVQPDENPETNVDWKPHPDAVVRDDVPHGTIETMPAWESKIFEKTTRDWFIYVPAQYKKESPAALMVFQDGHRFLQADGRWRVPVVFDNLIAKGLMPPTIAVFINPGSESSPASRQDAKFQNRSFEYNNLGDRYARFLIEEILPEVEKRYSISSDPNMRAIAGSSSGGICAFTVAWERPDSFRKVLTHVGSFTNLAGGDAYQSLIRKTEPKPIRVFMTDTSGDLDNAAGSWPLANKQIASSLAYMGYDVRFDWAEGYKHNPDFGGERFPEGLTWLWRKESQQPMIDTKGDLKGDLTLLRQLVPGQSWEIVAENIGVADAPCSDADGNFYFSDMKAPAVYRIDAQDGKRTELAKEALSGMKFGPSGLIYGCQGAKNRVISLDTKTGTVAVVATGVIPNDLAVSLDGFIFITETKQQQVTRIEIATGQVSVMDTGITKPNGIVLSNDGGTLAVSDYGGPYTWTFRVQKNNTLDAKMPTMSMRLEIDSNGEFRPKEPPPYSSASKGDGSAVDKIGRYYVTSALGIQIFDPTGRMCGVLPMPNPGKPLTSCTLGGVNHEFLYVTNGDKIFRRLLKME
jgi:enterochelin esterase-like enzyme/sugar lactone lactonase YvrE